MIMKEVLKDSICLVDNVEILDMKSKETYGTYPCLRGTIDRSQELALLQLVLTSVFARVPIDFRPLYLLEHYP